MSRIGRSKGFTLMEVLLAAVLVGGALVAVVQALGSSLGALHRSRTVLQAARLLEDRIIELEQQSFESKKVSLGQDQGTFERSGVVYEWTAAKAPTVFKDVSLVTAEVLWKEKHKPRALGVSLYVADAQAEASG